MGNSAWAISWVMTCIPIDMLPSSGEYFNAFESMLVNILSNLSSSSKRLIVSDWMERRTFIFFCWNPTIKRSAQALNRGMTLVFDTFSLKMPFSILLKSSSWLISLSIRSVLCLITWKRLDELRLSFGFSSSVRNAPYIMVNGVRNSWEIFVKYLMFIMLAYFSCSRWTVIFRIWSLFCLIRR